MLLLTLSVRTHLPAFLGLFLVCHVSWMGGRKGLFVSLSTDIALPDRSRVAKCQTSPSTATANQHPALTARAMLLAALTQTTWRMLTTTMMMIRVMKVWTPKSAEKFRKVSVRYVCQNGFIKVLDRNLK